jgi:hypothetical protein
MKKPVFGVFSLFLLLTLAGCLALEGLASPAVAKTIVVTTLTDGGRSPEAEATSRNTWEEGEGLPNRWAAESPLLLLLSGFCSQFLDELSDLFP